MATKKNEDTADKTADKAVNPADAPTETPPTPNTGKAPNEDGDQPQPQNDKLGIWNISKNERQGKQMFVSYDDGNQHLAGKHERTTSNTPNEEVYIDSESGDLLAIRRV